MLFRSMEPGNRVGKEEQELLDEVAQDVAFARSKLLSDQREKDLQQFWESTLDSLTTHIAVLDEKADVIAVNSAWRRFGDENGLELPDYGIGSNYLEIADNAFGESSEGAAETGSGIRKLLKGEKEFFHLEYPCHSPEKQRWFYLRATQFRSHHGERVVLAHENITQLKLAELDREKALDNLQKSQQQLIDQERQQALTTMASGIAHDFNNALSPIQGFADLLLENSESRNDEETLIQYLKRIRTSANTASETVRRMRKFYRPREENPFVTVDLNKVIKEAVAVTRPRWEKEAQASGRHIEISTQLDATCSISGNEGELHEMLTNLIFNAVDAMPEGGVINIKTYDKDGYVFLEFGDTGEGMSEETKTKCFDPFYTTKGAKGSGLGLATLQGTVERHGGDVEIKSTEGEGTSFRIYLPVIEKETSTAEQEKVAVETRKLNILVIEDEESQHEWLSTVLDAEGHNVDGAFDGSEGLRKFNSNRYDLIITDRAMPEMNGVQLAANIKKTDPAKPIIMLTGFGDMMDAADEKPDHVDLVVSKPISREKLQNAIAQVIK